MRLSRRLRTILVFTLAPVLVYLGVLNLADRVKWKTASDGISWDRTEQGLRLVEFRGRSSLGPAREGDLLRDINGMAVGTFDEYVEVVEVLSGGKREGTTADYTFVRPPTGEELTVPVRLSVESQFSGVDIPLVLVALAFLVVGILTYLRNSRAAGAFHFLLLCFVAFCLLLFRYSGRADAMDIAFYWVSAVAFLLLPPLFLHFCLRFPRRWEGLATQRPAILLLYAPAVLAGAVHLTWFLGDLRGFGLPRTPASAAFLDRVELVYFLFYFLLSALVLFRCRQLAVSHMVERKQLQWILAGTILGLGPFGMFYMLPFLVGIRVVEWMEASVLSLVLIPLCFGYAIAKFRLQDVDLIFKRGVSYVIASSALLAFYVAIALLIGKAFQDLSPSSGFLFMAVAALLAAALFAPLRERVQEQIDRYFYKERYGYRRSFQDFSRTLGSEIQLSRLIERISDRLRRTLDVSPVILFLRDDRQLTRFVPEITLGQSSVAPPSEIVLSEWALGRLAEGDAIQDSEAIADDLRDIRNGLYRWDIRYLEPLVVRGRVIGFLALGRRKNGDLLSSEDFEMVQGLARYAAIAIDNALLYRSLEGKAQELQNLRIYSDNVIESINLGVAVISAEGKVTVWNGAMAGLLGVPKEDAINQLADQLLPGGLLEALREITDGPGWLVSQPSHVYKAHIQGADGEGRLVNAALSPFISQDDVNTGTLLVLDNVTSRVQLENQLQQAERLSSIGLFAAGIAHEVNTPLAGISSYAQLMLQDMPPEDPRCELLKKIEQQSFKASEILNNLLNFARFSDREFEEVNLNSLMLDTLSLLDPQLRRGRVEVDMDFDPSLPRTVGNGGKLQQVFMNLFLNARDSMPNGGCLRVTTRSKNSELVIKIADTGTGISRENIKRIYDPFFTTKSVGKGTGLGLSITYGIVQEHSGRITVESDPGRGTTFSLYLPLRRVS